MSARRNPPRPEYTPLTPTEESAFLSALREWETSGRKQGQHPLRKDFADWRPRHHAPRAPRWALIVAVLAIAVGGSVSAVLLGGTNPNEQNRAVAREMEAAMSTDRLPDTQGTRLVGDESRHRRYLRQKAREEAAAKRRSRAAAATESRAVSSSAVRTALDERHLYLTLRSTNGCNKGDSGCAFAVDHPSLSRGTDIYAAGQALRAIFDAEPSLSGAAVVLYDDGTPYLKVGCDSDAVDWSAAPSSVVEAGCDVGF